MSPADKTRPALNPRGWRLQLLIAAATLIGVICYAVYKNRSREPSYPPARVSAWEKVTPRLSVAEQAALQTADRHGERVRAFFAERKQRSRAFAEEVLSLSGKWEFVKSKLPFTDAGGHRRYLRERFEQVVVSGPELQELIQSVVASYVSELQGIENDLLVRLRADLSDSDLAQAQGGVMLRTEEAFRQEYARSLEQAAAVVARDLTVQVGRETVTWVSADIATNLTLSLATVLAERLGLSAGILGAGATSSIATLGVGIAAGFIVDALLDRVLQALGHDPAGDIAAKVGLGLDMFQALLLDGDGPAVSAYQELRHLEKADPFQFVRDECRQAADRIETGGRLGLRNELKRLQKSRAGLREAALKRLILEGGQS